MIERKCECCGKTYKRRDDRVSKYCSRECKGKIKTLDALEIRCCPCGANFSVRKKVKQIYCSKTCVEYIKNNSIKARKQMLGNKPTLETRKKVSNSLMGHTVSKETRSKISKSHIGIKPSLETREKMRKSKLNNLNTCKRNMLKSLKKQRATGFISKIEKKVIHELTSNGINIHPQYELFPYLFDIYIPDKNLLIEVNGDYWHCNPEVYKRPKNNTQKRRIRLDKAKKTLALKQGFNVLTIWEKDINDGKLDTILKSQGIY